MKRPFPRSERLVLQAGHRAADETHLAVSSGDAQHRVDDALVARAPAEVARDRHTNIVVRGVWAIAQELDERGYHSRGAEPALQAMLILEGLLQGMQLRRRRRDTFNGRHALPVYLHGKHQTGTCRSAVHEHGAGTAHALLAAHMRAR